MICERATISLLLFLSKLSPTNKYCLKRNVWTERVFNILPFSLDWNSFPINKSKWRSLKTFVSDLNYHIPIEHLREGLTSQKMSAADFNTSIISGNIFRDIHLHELNDWPTQSTVLFKLSKHSRVITTQLVTHKRPAKTIWHQ